MERKTRFTHHYQLTEMNATRMRKLMMKHANFFKHGKGGIGTKPTNCTMEIALACIEDPSDWPFSSIVGISEIPWIRPNGEIIWNCGYDAESRMLLQFDQAMVDSFSDIPKRPTKDQAIKSRDIFVELLKGFPFVEDTDLAVAFSMLLSLVMRGVIDIVPLHALNAPTSGTGKSFLVDLLLTVVTGRIAPAMEQGTTVKEFQARINGAMLMGRTLINVDNWDPSFFPIQGSLLNQIISQKELELRKLGESPTIIVPNRALAFINGNNLSYFGDIHTRAVQGTMNTRMAKLEAHRKCAPDPTTRVFEFNPVKEAMKHRVNLLRHAYMLAAYGMTAAQAISISRPNCRFEEWDQFVRHTIMSLDLADPWKSNAEVKLENVEGKTFENLIEAWHAHFGPEKTVMVKDVANMAYANARAAQPDLWNACFAVAPKGRDQNEIDNQALGKAFEQAKDRTHDIGGIHFSIVRVPKTRGGKGLWVLTADPSAWK
jgi:putative DNA primase/helicase